MSSDSPTSGPGLVISTTKPIFSFLISASTDPQLSKELQQTASNLSSKPNVPYNSTSRSELSGSLRGPQPDPNWSNSSPVPGASSPAPNPKKSEELEARLEKLAEMSERNAYAELVKDVTPRKDINSLSLFTRINWGLNAVGGILGLVIGMLVEALIFIIQASRFDLKSTSSTSNIKKNQ